MVDRFGTTYEQIVARGGRVKMIGDEVMFRGHSRGGSVEIALALVEAHAGDDALPNVPAWPILSNARPEGDLFAHRPPGEPWVNWRTEHGAVGRGLGLAARPPRLELRHLRPVNCKASARRKQCWWPGGGPRPSFIRSAYSARRRRRRAQRRAVHFPAANASR
jgi:hypothetical protein